MTKALNKSAGSGPLTADYYNSLGLFYASQQKHQEAIQAFKKALDLDSGCIEAFYNQALTLTALGRLNEAIDSYANALRVRPDFVDAYYNLGNLWQKEGFFEKAIEVYRLSVKLKPDFPEAYNNLGLCLKALERFEQAVECYEKAVKLKPDYAEAYNNLGLALQGQGLWEQAIEKFESAIMSKPDHSSAHYNLGYALNEIGKLDAAANHYRRSIQLEPDFGDAHNNLGAILKRQGRIDEAIAHYRTALEHSVGKAEIYNNLGNALKKSNRIDEALEMFRRALAARPDYAEAYNNMGVALQFRGEYPAALVCYEKAFNLKPEFAEARFNRATIDLLHGNFSRGWQDYEWRFKKRHWKDVYPLRHKLPRWDGSPFPQKRLLVFGEQGFGDTIHFVRYLPRVKALGGTVIFETRKPLLACLQGVDGIDEMIDRSTVGDPAEACDLVVPLLSLPGIFGTDLQDMPAKVPYLYADETKVSYWKKKIRGSKFKVGLVWAGNPDQENDHLRSIPLMELLTLADIPGLQLFGLQKGTAANQMREIPADICLIDLGNELEDFSDTAAAMINLDLIVSVCTAPAHLAGALGRPVWTLLSHAADWRWMLDRDDSPWYPTMRLFRQPRCDDWQGALRQLKSELKGMIQKHCQISRIPRVGDRQRGLNDHPMTTISRAQSHQPGLSEKDDIQAEVNAIPYWHQKIAPHRGVVTPGWASIDPKSNKIPKISGGIRMIEKTGQRPQDFIVMGVCSYDTRTVRWLDTLRAHYDGHTILVMTSDYPAGLAKAYDVDIHRVVVRDDFWQNQVGLGCYQWHYIKSVAEEFQETYILRTDVFDVVFQDDPRNYVAGDQEWIYVEQEGMLNRDNGYMRDWFSINPDVNPVIYQQPVYNVGAICARGKQLAAIAAFISQRRGGTYADQTELAVYMHNHREDFASIPLFFGHFADMLAKMQITGGRYFVDKKTSQKYCVCHSNGKTNHYLDSVYPHTFYAKRFTMSSSSCQAQSAVELTIGIPVKDRPVELALLLQSLLNQTFQNFSVLLVNDCQENDFLNKNSTVQGLLKLLESGGAPVTIVAGDHKGPQYCGQQILENAAAELIFRLDDDVVLLPDCLQKLLAVLTAGYDAVGPIYLDPRREMRDQSIPAGTSRQDLIKMGRIYWKEDLFLSGILQVNLLPTEEPVPVEHLNSGFLYRKAAAQRAGGYFLGYSVVGHREETDISYRMFRSGAKLAVAPAARAYHFHPAYGGIRETKGNLMHKNLWDSDERIFRERMRGWMKM